MLCCILASCGAPPEGEESSVPSGEALSLKAQEPGSDEAPQKEMRAVWITYYEISMKAQNGGDESLFYQKVDEMFSRVQNAGFNTCLLYTSRSAICRWRHRLGIDTEEYKKRRKIHCQIEWRGRRGCGCSRSSATQKTGPMRKSCTSG